MDSIKIKKRTTKVRDAVLKEWYERYWEFINANPYKDFLDWDSISINPNLTIEFINSNLDKPWNWNYISANPSITIKYTFFI